MEPPLDAKVIRPGGWKAYLGGSLALFGSSAIPSCFFRCKEIDFGNAWQKIEHRYYERLGGQDGNLLVFG